MAKNKIREMERRGRIVEVRCSCTRPMRAVVVVGKVWRELFEDFAETLPIVRAGRTKYNSGSIFKSRLPKHYTPLHLYIPTHHQDFIY